MNKTTSEVYNEDCILGMQRYSDKFFDLAIVDPPYGIGFSAKKKNKFRKCGLNHIDKDWDNEIPTKEYWNQLFRVSKNQIVWGGNYMTEFLPPSRCWISWYKMQEFSTNEFELAWTSFELTCKQFNYSRVQSYSNINKIHPTQKPIKLYDWIIQNYAKGCTNILDTHLGSGSSRIACYKNGINFVGFELDKEYFDAQEKRFNNFKLQQTLF